MSCDVLEWDIMMLTRAFWWCTCLHQKFALLGR